MAGRYWLDLPAYDTYLRARHARLRGALLTVVLLFIAFAALTTFAGVIAAR